MRLFSALIGTMLLATGAFAEPVSLSGAALLTTQDVPGVAVEVLTEEWARRTAEPLTPADGWPADTPGIRLLLTSPDRPEDVPSLMPDARADAYAVVTDTTHDQPRLWIVGADPRGLLYGIGHVLRTVEWRADGPVLKRPLNVRTAPAYPLRGHQLGYRHTANAYDAWTPAQYEQYIRELALFGANAIENIPFQDADSPNMPVTREEMNVEMSRICAKYGLEYWIWSPATFDLDDQPQRAELLEQHRELFAATPRLDAVFFPGGDPGNNHPRLVMPFLEDLSVLLHEYHPDAKVWISLQGFGNGRDDWFYEWVHENLPDWLGGVVCGPGSPPIPETRARTPQRYPLRHYPDITHTVRSQYPTPWFDPAFAFTLGREPVNPEPLRYASVHNHFAPYTEGFIAYSDGMNDDVNKFVWLARGWDPEAPVRDILRDYARLFFPGPAPDTMADALLALERNWQGGLAMNSGVDGTLRLWREIEDTHPALLENWRFQAHLMRAYYDAYTRHRLLYETALEEEANQALARADAVGADVAMAEAEAVLERAEDRVQPAWRDRVFALCEDLFESIGYQSSVERYGARSGERSAVLDYIDIPLNNRWWLEDQFAEIRELDDEAEKRARLETIRTWADPGPGGFYDNIGHVGESPNVVHGETYHTDPNNEHSPNPDCMWWDGGFTRERHAWVSYMMFPLGLRYSGLDPDARYIIQTTGNRKCLLMADGQRLEPDKEITGIGEKKTFVVPKALTADTQLLVTFEKPHEPDINWRHASRLTEIWLIKQ